MKVLAALLIVGLLYGLPVYLFDALVMPELVGLRETYVRAGQTSEQIAAGSK